MLEVAVDGEEHVGRHRPLDENILEIAEAEVAAGKFVAIAALDAGPPVREGEEPGDVTEEVAGGVLALAFERVVGRHRLGQDGAVGREDLASRPAEVAHCYAGVAGVVGQGVVTHDLEVVELQKQQHEQAHQDDADASDLVVHPATVSSRSSASEGA